MSDDERKKQVAELTKTLKEGERLVGPTRRPDGSLRKGFRIRANYTPPDEVPKYQPKPALVRFLIFLFSLFFFLPPHDAVSHSFFLSFCAAEKGDGLRRASRVRPRRRCAAQDQVRQEERKKEGEAAPGNGKIILLINYFN